MLYQEQDAALDRFYGYLENSQWICCNYQRNPPKPPSKPKFTKEGNPILPSKNFKLVNIKCTKGLMITINSTKNLYRDLKENYGVSFLMTANTCTDPIESDFSGVRAMDGQNDDPNGSAI